jgi:PAS domain S-box-containing protein
MTDAPPFFSPEQTDAVVRAAKSRDQGREAVIATDAAGRILYWNDQPAFLYGWEAEDVMGKNVLDITPTRNSTDGATQIMEEMRNGNAWTGKFIARHRDGTPLLAHVRNFLVRDREVVIGVVGISRPSSRKTPPNGTPKRTIAD